MSRHPLCAGTALRAASCVILGLALLCLPSAALAGGNLNFVYGERSLDEDFWEPTDDQTVIGVEGDFGGDDWPITIAIGYWTSDDDGTLSSFPILGSVDLDAELSEWSVGIHKVWKAGSARPFVGGGVSFVEADAEVSSVFGDADDSDDSNGVYVEGGVFWRLGTTLNLGLHARLLEGTDLTLFDVDGDADYWQIGGLLGFGW